jgi:hypothetical protein
MKKDYQPFEKKTLDCYGPAGDLQNPSRVELGIAVQDTSYTVHSSCEQREGTNCRESGLPCHFQAASDEKLKELFFPDATLKNFTPAKNRASS